MARYLAVAVLALAFGSRAWAGGPPPVYVVVDKVVLEPNADAPERIRIEGCFVRQTEELLREMKEKGLPWESTYSKPVEGYVYMSIEPGKEKECRAEWAKWQKAAGTGKVVSVGACVMGGSLRDRQDSQAGRENDTAGCRLHDRLPGSRRPKLCRGGSRQLRAPICSGQRLAGLRQGAAKNQDG